MSMIARPFSENPILGTKTTWWHDDVTDEVVLETSQDSTPLAEANYEARKDKIGCMTKMGDGDHLVAELPMHLLMDLKRRGIYDPSDPKGKGLLTWLRDHGSIWRTDTRRYV